jgi:hypothetical protein
MLKVNQIGLPLVQRLLKDRLYTPVDVKGLDPRGMLEVVDNATDLQSINVPVKEIIVSMVGGTLPAEDPNVMASTQTAAELESVLLNASGGRGRKSISDLKDSH